MLHFVTGGFSGATGLAVDIVHAHLDSKIISPILVLRKKKTTTADKLAQLTAQGIPFEVVTGKAHLLTILELSKLCRRMQADVIVCHGFPEHIIGRWAGLLAKTKVLVQVEHSSKERYTPWRLWQSRYLSQYTHAVVGVSQGVLHTLQIQKLQSKQMCVIANGIDSEVFDFKQDKALASTALSKRAKDIIMVGRFAKDKDHITLLKALKLLNKNSSKPYQLSLVGDGKTQQKMQQLADKLGLKNQVVFLGRSNQVATLLKQHKVCVLSSLREGMSLSVLESMASGCVTVGSRIAGVTELIDDNKDGFLFDVGDDKTLAQILVNILDNPDKFQTMAEKARNKVVTQYDKTNIGDNYIQLIKSLMK